MPSSAVCPVAGWLACRPVYCVEHQQLLLKRYPKKGFAWPSHSAASIQKRCSCSAQPKVICLLHIHAHQILNASEQPLQSDCKCPFCRSMHPGLHEIGVTVSNVETDRGSACTEPSIICRPCTIYSLMHSPVLTICRCLLLVKGWGESARCASDADSTAEPQNDSA